MMTEEIKSEKNYYIENIKVDENTALKYWKKVNKTVDSFFETVISNNAHPEMLEFGQYVSDKWDSIPDVTVQEAFEEKNIEVRRLFFRAIGVAEMFKELEPVLIDKQVLEKEGVSWIDLAEIPVTMRDEYELYEIQGSKLFPEEKNEWRVGNATVYAVRCWCSTTGREYWIYVPKWVGDKKDALEAIAWTVQLDITNPEYIYRQGDVILAKHSSTSEECRPYHLDKDQYVKLLKAES
jgi:hypothetical protein